MTIERAAAVTFRGTPLTLLGPRLNVGDRAPDFEAIDTSMESVRLADTNGTVRIFSVVPSLDTPVCDSQTRRFNKEAAQLGDVRIYTISMDLPFAQSRWCSAAGIDHIVMLSDHRSGSFGINYGTLIKELRLNSRAIFVVDKDDTVRYVEYVPEVGDHPNYEAALQAARELLSA
ncbi:MAG TPA: thiol peroxidase [Acidobacteriota bacterium]|nr:thiol peroxidase [Acidobacteriota bacterium]